MISTLVMTRLGFVRDGQMVAMKPGNAKLRALRRHSRRQVIRTGVRADAAWRGSALQ